MHRPRVKYSPVQLFHSDNKVIVYFFKHSEGDIAMMQRPKTIHLPLVHPV